MDFIDLVVKYQELKESMKLAIKELQEYDEEYKNPSQLRLKLQISIEQYKEIMK